MQVLFWFTSYFAPMILSVGILIPAASAISQRHAGELYLLWYLFSLFFLLFFALNFAAGWSHQELRDFLGNFAFVYDWLTDASGELLFAGAVIYLGIGPQLLTYLLSGLFGAASPPKFVHRIRTVAILSLVKFLMGVSGIALAEAFAELWFKKAVYEKAGYKALYYEAVSKDFIGVLIGLAMAFALAAFHFEPRWLVNFRPRRSPMGVSWLRNIHRFFTRRSEPVA